MVSGFLWEHRDYQGKSHVPQDLNFCNRFWLFAQSNQKKSAKMDYRLRFNITEKAFWTQTKKWLFRWESISLGLRDWKTSQTKLSMQRASFFFLEIFTFYPKTKNKWNWISTYKTNVVQDWPTSPSLICSASCAHNLTVSAVFHSLQSSRRQGFNFQRRKQHGISSSLFTSFFSL